MSGKASRFVKLDWTLSFLEWTFYGQTVFSFVRSTRMNGEVLALTSSMRGGRSHANLLPLVDSKVRSLDTAACLFESTDPKDHGMNSSEA